MLCIGTVFVLFGQAHAQQTSFDPFAGTVGSTGILTTFDVLPSYTEGKLMTFDDAMRLQLPPIPVDRKDSRPDEPKVISVESVRGLTAAAFVPVSNEADNASKPVQRRKLALCGGAEAHDEGARPDSFADVIEELYYSLALDGNEDLLLLMAQDAERPALKAEFKLSEQCLAAPCCSCDAASCAISTLEWRANLCKAAPAAVWP
ncbi:hypothetical protein [Candidatus Electronema sp. JM]|uniref:hypothetical protein n=1 Tax=Candidatus Electronema sp. JM TaxID=3401571 RepID=UPI003AA9D1B4